LVFRYHPLNANETGFRAVERVDFIKCAVEGFEYNVFFGGRQTLERQRPGIYCEINPYFHQRLGGDAARVFKLGDNSKGGRLPPLLFLKMEVIHHVHTPVERYVRWKAISSHPELRCAKLETRLKKFCWHSLLQRLRCGRGG